MPIVHAAQELPCTSYGGQHSQQLQKPRSIHKPFSNAHSAGLRKQHVRGFHHLSRSRDKESSSDRTTSSSKADRDLWQTEGLSKRQSLLSASAFLGLSLCRKAYAFEPPPQGYKLLRDRLDGYSFFLPETWTPLSSSGNDVFYRNPYNVNENLFVSISSPSSSKYNSVDDLKSPQAAAERTKQQYLRELLSTRLGVKRTTDIISAAERIGNDGRKYYDLELEAKSYASRNQLAVSQKQIDAAFELEWDRHYITVLGVANKRLYEFRLQTARDTYDKAKDTLLYIAQSFKCVEAEN